MNTFVNGKFDKVIAKRLRSWDYLSALLEMGYLLWHEPGDVARFSVMIWGIDLHRVVGAFTWANICHLSFAHETVRTFMKY